MARWRDQSHATALTNRVLRGAGNAIRDLTSRARGLEARRRSVLALPGLRSSRIEATAPAPQVGIGWIARAHGDRADAHVAVIDQPGLLQGVRIPAAGEHNHAPTIAWTGLGVKPLYVGPSLRGRAMARARPWIASLSAGLLRQPQSPNAHRQPVPRGARRHKQEDRPEGGLLVALISRLPSRPPRSRPFGIMSRSAHAREAKIRVPWKELGKRCLDDTIVITGLQGVW